MSYYHKIHQATHYPHMYHHKKSHTCLTAKCMFSKIFKILFILNYTFKTSRADTLSCRICLPPHSRFSDCENWKCNGTSLVVRLAFNHISNVSLTLVGFCANSENMSLSACKCNNFYAIHTDKTN